MYVCLIDEPSCSIFVSRRNEIIWQILWQQPGAQNTIIKCEPWWPVTLQLISDGALVKASSYLAVGSALLHGSQTSLGGTFDVRLNDLIIYLMYQDAMKSFESLGSPVITDLSDTFRHAWKNNSTCKSVR